MDDGSHARPPLIHESGLCGVSSEVRQQAVEPGQADVEELYTLLQKDPFPDRNASLHGEHGQGQGPVLRDHLFSDRTLLTVGRAMWDTPVGLTARRQSFMGSPSRKYRSGKKYDSAACYIYIYIQERERERIVDLGPTWNK
jgi:hypothetical protein